MSDAKQFRDALGQFATGVTIVTTLGADGTPVGVTANSYNSVSLDPPLVLWSLAKSARSIGAFQNADAFAIHILGEQQQDLASRFASRGEDKFAGLSVGRGHGGAPLLPDCAAHFECRTSYRYEGGDHVIFVGEVVHFETSDKPPLVFHQGRFTRMHRTAGDTPADRASGSRYTDDFIPYLLSRAHLLVSHPVRQFCEERGVTERDYATLGLLSMTGSATGATLTTKLAHTGQAPNKADIAKLDARGWIEADGGAWRLTAGGRALFIEILSRSRAMEQDLLEGFPSEEVSAAKRFLRHVIDKASIGLPPLID